MKFFIFIFSVCFFTIGVFAQNTHESFELRYFTNDTAANGETDFKGETEWMDTEQRIRFLGDYAGYASRFFGNPGFNEKIVTEKEVGDVLANLKPRPLTSVRQTIPLNDWKAYGYKPGQDVA
ncbi:MAG: hypothetical protein ACOCVA_07725, partial [Prolixibacteraceae bacterium]